MSFNTDVKYSLQTGRWSLAEPVTVQYFMQVASRWQTDQEVCVGSDIAGGALIV